MLPSLDLGVSYGYFDSFDPKPSIKGTEWAGGITLTIPLFDRLANYGSYQAAVHGKQAALLQLERVKRQSKADYDSAYKSLQISLQSAFTREKTVGVSRRLYEANLKRYKRALVNANDLQIDQDRLIQSELLAIRGWGEVHEELTKTCHSIGKRLADCLKINPEKS